ncbi:hypothetical protein V8C42DRAFT_358400 [Trichoderma barbatum]
MAAWYSLPTEIRTMILKLLQSHKDHGATIKYAAVSKEWQIYFERFNFRRLIIGQSCIPELGRIVRGHWRRMVEHIWLRVELARYLCPACEWPEKPLEIMENNQIFTAALYQLLDVLSTWKTIRQYGVSNGGLVLELSAYSPSDSEHYFSYPLGKDNYPHKYDENCIVDDSLKYGTSEDLPLEDNTTHELSVLPYLERARGACRLFGSLTKLDYRKLDVPKANRRLPKVSVVKELLHRRRYPRSFHPDTLLNVQRVFDVFLRQSGSLKRLSIYGDHVSVGSKGYKPYGISPSLGWTLADESHSFEHLSVMFLADAKDFFRDFWPGYAPKSADMSRSGVQRALMSHLSSSQRRALGKPRKSPEFERRL